MGKIAPLVMGGGIAVVAAVFSVSSPDTHGLSGVGLSLAKGLIPARYQTLVEKHGNDCPQLTPALLAAQLQQESGWNPKAKSPAGAEGIAQFIPGTWATHGVDGNGDGRRDVYDPEDAIPSAAAYMCDNFKAVKDVPGNPVANALAAYNAGSAAVIRAGGVPDFRETKNYVAVITKTAATFSNASKRDGVTGDRAGVTAVRDGVTGDRDALVAEAVNWAQTNLGTPYVWGGDGNDNAAGGFDCSGLTKAAYAEAGITLPRVANDQWNAGEHPARDELMPGDLVFFARDKNNPRSIHHVGLYVGGGYMINAPRPGTEIRFDPIDLPDYFGATRPDLQKGAQA